MEKSEKDRGETKGKDLLSTPLQEGAIKTASHIPRMRQDSFQSQTDSEGKQPPDNSKITELSNIAQPLGTLRYAAAQVEKRDQPSPVNDITPRSNDMNLSSQKDLPIQIGPDSSHLRVISEGKQPIDHSERNKVASVTETGTTPPRPSASQENKFSPLSLKMRPQMFELGSGDSDATKKLHPADSNIYNRNFVHHCSLRLPIVVWQIWQDNQTHWDHSKDNIDIKLVINDLCVTRRWLPSHDFDTYTAKVAAEDEVSKIEEIWYSTAFGKADAPSKSYWKKGNTAAWDFFTQWQIEDPDVWERILIYPRTLIGDFDVGLEFVFQGRTMAVMRWPTTLIYSKGYGRGGHCTILVPYTSYITVARFKTVSKETTGHDDANSLQGQLLSPNHEVEESRRQRTSLEREIDEEQEEIRESSFELNSSTTAKGLKVVHRHAASNSNTNSRKSEESCIQVTTPYSPSTYRLVLSPGLGRSEDVRLQFNTYFCHRIPLIIWDFHKFRQTEWDYDKSNITVYLMINKTKITRRKLPASKFFLDLNPADDSNQGGTTECDNVFYSYATNEDNGMDQAFAKHAEGYIREVFTTWQQENSSEWDQLFVGWSSTKTFNVSTRLDFQGAETVSMPWPCTVLLGEMDRKIMYMPCEDRPTKIAKSLAARAQAASNKISTSDYPQIARNPIKSEAGYANVDHEILKLFEDIQRRHSKALEAFSQELQVMATGHDALNDAKMTIGLVKGGITTELWSTQLSAWPKSDTKSQLAWAWMYRTACICHNSLPSLGNRPILRNLRTSSGPIFACVSVFLALTSLYSLCCWLPKRIVGMVIGWAWSSASDWQMEKWLSYWFAYYILAVTISVASPYYLYRWTTKPK